MVFPYQDHHPDWLPFHIYFYQSLVRKTVCFGLYIDKTCVPDVFSESLLNMDTWIIWTLWHVVPLVSVLTGFHCTIIFFLPTEYRIMLAIAGNRSLYCTDAQVFVASWWKINSHVVEFLSAIFARFHVHLYIPWVSTYGGVWSVQGLSYICISVKLDPYIARHVIESLLHKEETSLNISGKEVDLVRNLFHKQRMSQKSINIQQSFRLGRRATLNREGLINVNRNLEKAIYKKEDLSTKIGDVCSGLP